MSDARQRYRHQKAWAPQDKALAMVVPVLIVAFRKGRGVQRSGICTRMASMKNKPKPADPLLSVPEHNPRGP
eukprot:7838417-Lingulodinium_polyedra.AAC.1